MMREVTKIIEKIAGSKKSNSIVSSIVDLTPCLCTLEDHLFFSGVKSPRAYQH